MEVNKQVFKDIKMCSNNKDIKNFLIKNKSNIKEVDFFNSGGNCYIFYVNLNNKIYSISDEPLENNTDCIIYDYEGSIKGFIQYYYNDIEMDIDKIKYKLFKV